MFDIGFWELLLVAVVALFVVGPERFPGLIKSAGYWLGRVRETINNVKTEIRDELETAEDLKRLSQEQQDLLKRTEQEFNQILHDRIADPSLPKPMPASSGPPSLLPKTEVPGAGDSTAKPPALPDPVAKKDN